MNTHYEAVPVEQELPEFDHIVQCISKVGNILINCTFRGPDGAKQWRFNPAPTHWLRPAKYDVEGMTYALLIAQHALKAACKCDMGRTTDDLCDAALSTITAALEAGKNEG